MIVGTGTGTAIIGGIESGWITALAAGAPLWLAAWILLACHCIRAEVRHVDRT